MRLAISNRLAKDFNTSTLSSYTDSGSHQFRTFTNLFKSRLKSVIPCRFTLEKGEVFKVPSSCRELQVSSGAAWITVAGKDIVLSSGGKVSLPSHKDSALISALGDTPLTIEVLSFVG